MRKVVIGIVALAALSIASTANAGSNDSTLTGVAIGAGSGAVIAGPIGAVAGGLIGAVVGGPTFHRQKHCWRDDRGRRHCKWY
jgi:osmotically inducible lipoprotein OsmB